MTPKPVQLAAGDSLESVLAKGGSLPVDRSTYVLFHAAKAVAALHTAGRLHLSISPEAISIYPDGTVRLAAPHDGRVFEGLRSQEETAPAAMRQDRELRIPGDISSARQILAAAGIPLQPMQIDVYQLGALLCRLISGESIGSYLRSPRTKGKVPTGAQSIIEKCLGKDQDPANSFLDGSQLLAAISGLLEQNQQTIATGTSWEAVPSVHDTSPTMGPAARIPDTAVSPSVKSSAPSASEIPFRTLGHYRIDVRIGRGGMGDVYLAYESTLDRKVAIKVLPSDFSRHADFVRRFYAEATAAAKLHHPNIVQVYYIGEDRGHHFFAMQFVDGESLGDLLRRRGRLSPNEAVAVIQQALSGLAAAHKAGLIHRDIKPGNILLDASSRRALLADFGLVKSIEGGDGRLTATGMVMGTVDYISPEQGRGQTVDARSDLYSIGVVLYQLLSGKLPFSADSATAMIFQHVYETAQPLLQVAPDVPASLSHVVGKLMSKAPDERYQTVEELAADLRAFRVGKPLPSGVDGAVENEDGSIAGAGVAEHGLSRVITAPDFREAPGLPPDLDDAAPTGRWQRVGKRIFEAVQRQAPGLIERLQNTQQQVDGAVDTYSRRHRQLKRLLAEAERVRAELAIQQAAWEAAAREAEVKSAQAVDDEAARSTGMEEAIRARQAANDLSEQITLQDDELASMRLHLAQVSATLEKLHSQRGLLSARLKVAQARLHVDGNARPIRVSRRLVPSTWPRAVQAAAVLFVIFSAASIFLFDRIANSLFRTGNEAEDSLLVSNKYRTDATFALPDGPLGIVHTFDAHHGSIGAIAFSPNGRYMATAADDTADHIEGSGLQTLYLWDLKTLSVAYQLEGPNGIVKKLRFSPAGDQVAALMDDHRTLFWPFTPGEQPERTVNSGSLGIATFGDAVDFAYVPGKDQIVVASNTAFTIVHSATLNTIGRWSSSNSDTSTVVALPDGDRIISGRSSPGTGGLNSEYALGISSIRQLRQIETLPSPELGSISLAVTPDGRWLLNGTANGFTLWDVQNASKLNHWLGNEAAISNDGRRILIASRDDQNKNILTLFDAATGRDVYKFGEVGQVHAIAFSPDGRHAVTGGEAGALKLWRLPDGSNDAEDRDAAQWVIKIGGKVGISGHSNEPTISRIDQLPDSKFQISSVDLSNNSLIQDGDLINLAGLARLDTLNLSGTHVSDAGLKYLTGLPSLKALLLAATKITDEAIPNLGKLTALQQLDVSDTAVSGKTFPQLTLESQLKYLHLSGTKVTDEYIPHLAALKQLDALYLNRTRVTDASMKFIRTFGRLRNLTLKDSMVTTQGIRELLQERPQMNVDY